MWICFSLGPVMAKLRAPVMLTLLLAVALASGSGPLIGQASDVPSPNAAKNGRAATGPSLQGRVTTSEGKPLAGVSVRLRPLLSAYERDLLAWRGEMPPVVHEVKSQSDGGYWLRAPDTGFWQLELSREGYESRLQGIVPLTEDMVMEDAELPPAKEVVVRLLDAAGEPVRARLLATLTKPATQQAMNFLAAESWQPMPWIGQSRADGRARLSLAEPDQWQLEAVAPHHQPRQLPLAEGETTVRLHHGESRLLQVVDADGGAVAGVVLRLHDFDLPLAASDEQGKLRAHLPQGPVTLTARDAEGRLQEMLLPAPTPAGEAVDKGETVDSETVDKGETVDNEVDTAKAASGEVPAGVFELPKGRRLTGRVLESRHRQPLAGALVWLMEHESLVWTRSDDTGGYSLLSPPAAPYGILAASPGYTPAFAMQGDLPTAAKPGPTLLLDPAASFEGLVVTADGTPIPDIDGNLELGASKGTFDFKSILGMRRSGARSDAQGRLSFTGLPVDRGFTLHLEGAGWAPVDYKVDPLQAFEQRTGGRWQMVPGRRGVGRIVDLEEQPVVGAEVQLQPATADSFRSFIMAEAAPLYTTDGSGAFAIPDLAAGRYDLVATASGYSRGQVRGLEIPVGEGEIDLGVVIMAPGVDLLGKVVDVDGQPIAEAEIFAMQSGDRGNPVFTAMAQGKPDTLSDIDGKFVIPDGTAGERRNILVTRQGFVSALAPNIELPQTKPLEVVLKPSSKIEGRVVDADGAPVEGANVVAWPEGRSSMDYGRSYSEHREPTGVDGRFELSEVAPGPTLIQVTKSGFQALTVGGLEVPADRPLQGVELRLVVGAQLSGTLTDAAGEPVGGALVKAMGPDGQMSEGGFAQTDGDGRFLISSLALGAHTISTMGEGLNRASKNIIIEPGENRVDLQMMATVTVSGHVFEASGRPLQGAQVMLHPQDQRGFMAGQTGADSLADGSFEIDQVPAGRYRVQAHKEGLGSRQLPEMLEVAEAPISGLELRLGGGGRVLGRILGLSYEDMNRVRVSAYADGAEVTQPDFEGKFRVDNVPAGEMTLVAQLAGTSRSARQKVVLEEGVSEVVADLEFVTGYQLTGTVYKSAQLEVGMPLNLSAVNATYHASTTTGSDGTFLFEDLQAGKYRLHLGDWRTQFRQTEELEIDGDEDLRIDLEVARLSGRVLDSDGQPLAGVQVIGVQGLRQVRVAGDSVGRFNMNEINTGPWELRFRRSGYGTETVRVELAAGEIRDDLEVRLEPVSGLTLEVRGPGGRPATQIHVSFSNGQGQQVGGTFQGDNRGQFIVNVVPDGAWQMVLASDGASTIERALRVPSDELVRIDLSEEARLSVRLPDLEGESVEATLQLVGPQGPYRGVSWQGMRRDRPSIKGGARELRGLTSGPWTVVATADDGRVWQGQVVLVAGQTATLELR